MSTCTTRSACTSSGSLLYIRRRKKGICAFSLHIGFHVYRDKPRQDTKRYIALYTSHDRVTHIGIRDSRMLYQLSCKYSEKEWNLSKFGYSGYITPMCLICSGHSYMYTIQLHATSRSGQDCVHKLIVIQVDHATVLWVHFSEWFRQCLDDDATTHESVESNSRWGAMTSAGDRSCNVYPMRVEGSERGEKMVQRAVDEDVEANAPYFAKRRRIISGERLYLHVCQDVN